MSAFGLLRQSDFWHHAQRMLCMVRIDGCAQILKPAPGRLIRNRGLTWLDGSQPIVLIRGTCRPVDEIAAELGFELADGFVTEEVVQIKQADQQQVVLRPGTEVAEAELIAHCRALIAHYKCPTTVEVRDSLPRTATGKLQKFKLRAPYWEGMERRVN